MFLATALAAGGLMITAATSASAAAPVAACAQVDPTHISVSLDADTGLLGSIANVATVTLTNSDTGAILDTIPSVSLLGGLVNLSLPSLMVPTGVTNIGYTIQPIPLLGGILAPIVGNTPCAALPVQALTGSYEVVSPARILDTRTGVGATTIPAKGTVTLVVAGKGGVPSAAGILGILGSTASAVNLNLTATNATAPGYLTVYPTGSAKPSISNLNFVAGKNIANTAIAELGTAGSIDIYNDSTKPVDVVGDVSGYYDTGVLTPVLPLTPGAYQPLTPSRLLDTRTLGTAGKLQALSNLTLPVTGVGGVPADAAAVVLNVTATGPTIKGHLRVYPAGGTLPFASNLNFNAGATVADTVTVAPGTGGAIAIYNGASKGNTDVIVDVIGYIAGGLLPAQTPGLEDAVTPFRLLDTRSGIGAPVGKVPAGGSLVVQVAGRDGVPTTTARAAVVTVTATNEVGPGFASLYPGPTRPTVSILNFVAATDVANLTITPINADGTITIYNGAATATDLLIDISGYITGATASVG